jgi:Holliday junction resolvase RusA-like endonuclease
MYSFDLRIKPEPQQRVRIYRKRAYDPSKEYKKSLKIQLLSQFSGELIDQPIFLSLTFRMPIPKSTTKAQMKAILNGEVFHVKRPDIDNLAKAALDALNDTIIKDDSQIYALHTNKVYSTCPGISMLLTTEP